MEVTEGLHDAQETTISRLGIAPYVDLLVTSLERAAASLPMKPGKVERREKRSCAMPLTASFSTSTPNTPYG
jgi:hypothetical protein